ncbi:MAG: DUF6062 family protein [Spirochaetota bacterium]
MKYELQTIPVWKAFEADPECVLCHLEQESEQRNTTFFLGSSVMAPEMRVRLNEHGFCRRHFHMLLGGQGKLGYSLALRTHLDTLAERYARDERSIVAARGRGVRKVVEEYAAELRRQETDCLMCDRMRANMLNFTYTIAKLFLDEGEFVKALSGSRGFCLHHLPGLLEMGLEVIPAKSLPGWHETLFELQRANVNRTRADLEAFTWQFDYQTEQKTPPEAQDAVPRAVQRLAGYGPR